MIIKFKSRFVYGQSIFTAACPRSEALFQLLRNREAINSSELSIIGKMGYEIQFVGDTHELSKELQTKDINYRKTPKGLMVEIEEEKKE